MPIDNGNYDQLTVQQIRDALEAELRNEFGNDIDLTESSVFTTLTTVLAEVISGNQEQSLQEVYEAGFIETATGIDLDRVVAILGISRRSAVHATGVQQFSAAGPVLQDYPIQSGTKVQTRETNPSEFETTEPTTLKFIDSFEDQDLSEYSGDTGSASIISDNNSQHGDYVLQMDATDGAHIYDDSFEVQRGTTFHAQVRPNASTVPIITFGVDKSNASNYYQIAVDEASDEVRLERVDGGTVAATIDTLSSAGLVTGEFHEIEWDWQITDNTAVTVYDPSDNELGTLGGSDDTYHRGGCGFKSGDANSTKEYDIYTTSAVSANIRALVGGEVGNVGANAINALPSPPTGVDSTTNLYPTASDGYVDTDRREFIIGKDRESDEELRDRASSAATGGGDATHDAIVSALINETPGVSSVTVYENKTDNDNTGAGGLPPHAFEVVVYGGSDDDVAETIFETKAVTARDYGGAHGTVKSITVTADTNGQNRTIDFSRPTEVDVDMSFDLVVDTSYVGDDAIRDDVARYVGGTLADGTSVVGDLGVGDNVRHDILHDVVVGGDNGVVALDQNVDGNPIETTPSATTVNGMVVVDIGANEVAQTNAEDASITINTRQI